MTKRCQSFAVNVFSDDQQRLAGVDDRFEKRNHIFNVGNLLFEDQDVAILKDAFHLLRVGDEVRREVAAIELHTFDPFDFRREALAFVDSDDAVFSDAVHRFCQKVTDLGVVVGRDATDLGGRLLVLDGRRHLLQLFGDVGDGLFHTGFELDRVDTSDDGTDAFVEDRFGHDRGRGGSVARHVARLRGNFADHLCAHVFIDVLKNDFLRNTHAVLGNGWRAEAFLKDDVAATRAEGDLDGLCQFGDAASHCIAGFLIESNHLCHGSISPCFGFFGWCCRTGVLTKLVSQTNGQQLKPMFMCIYRYGTIK